MATAIAQPVKPTAPAATKQPVVFPEVIEETRTIGDKITTVKYALGKMLGKGGFAHCLVGIHIPSKRQYAIKIVSKSALEVGKAKQKLQSEIRIHRALVHQNVVQFDHYFEDPQYAFIVLELCHHNSMSELMRRRHKLTEPEVRFYVNQLVDALQFLHHHLIIHRDLKLGNLFLDKNLNLKVGDFGLAAKLNSPDERRRTVCGTPNYIAPEILQGKGGHSFEVDIWSTGVIMYTLLVGKPPFESSDVKTTYNRILTNQFSFPPAAMVCDHAENLIRHLLQQKADHRPKLDRILQHSFFTRLSAWTPQSLPVSCLREPYVIPNSSCETEFVPVVRANDENDPNLINRNVSKATEPRAALKPASVGGFNVAVTQTSVGVQDRKQSSELTSKVASVVPSSNENAAQQPRRPAVPARSNSAVVGSVANTARTASRATTGNEKIHSSVPDTESVSSKPVTRAQSAINTKKFEVFSDKPISKIVTSGAQEQRSPPEVLMCPEKRPLGGYPSGGLSSAIPTGTGVTALATAPKRSAVGQEQQTSASAMDLIQHNLEGVKLSTDKVPSRRPATTTSTLSARSTKPTTTSPPQIRGSAIVSDESVRRPVVTAWEADNAALSSASTKPIQRYHSSAFQSATAVHHEPLQQRPLSPEHTSAPVSAVEGARAATSNNALTPPEQVQTRRDDKAQLNTLEAMHEVLAHNYGGVCVDDSLLADKQLNAALTSVDVAEGQVRRSCSQIAPGQGASVWVVRYVDYTSKYGLGFLLNTGSAGVYFNDSTKIVLSADGTVFQYIERRRRDNSPAADAGGEYTVQTHLLSRYPVELQKKVTLLCHFRNYLVDQQLNAKTTDIPADENPVNCHLEASAKQTGTAAPIVSGACSDVIFGVSSAVYQQSSTSSSGSRYQNYMSTCEQDQELPFLKKWVRTRHAILFRLSNRTVQIVFFDRSEILLSSEARVVTYVAKCGERSEHSLEDVLQSGRKDIAKRLKYTKDIMYRLINIQR